MFTSWWRKKEDDKGKGKDKDSSEESSFEVPNRASSLLPKIEDEDQLVLQNETPNRQKSSFIMADHLPQQLTPNEVYNALVGGFAKESNTYTLLDVVYADERNQFKESGRIYRDRFTNKLYILYYPGKDNDESTSVKSPELPLRQIINKVDAILSKKYDPILIDDGAKKIFVVCENSKYWGKKVSHFIKGSYQSGELKTVDSVDWYYNQNYIKNIFPNTCVFEKVKRPDCQNITKDNSSCGNHAIAAGFAEITRVRHAPVKITEEILEKHYECFVIGSRKVNKAFKMKLDPRNASKDLIEMNPDFYKSLSSSACLTSISGGTKSQSNEKSANSDKEFVFVSGEGSERPRLK